MNEQPKPFDDTVLHVSQPNELSRFHSEAARDLVIFKRAIPPTLKTWLADLPVRQWPHGRVLVAPTHCRAAMRDIFRRRRTPAGPARDLLLNDISMLVETFANLMGTSEVDIRIEVVRTRACWRFHRDRISARLITTYHGQTTQWVEPRDADDALQQQEAFAGRVHQIPSDAVALFRGSAQSDKCGVVHRSPPISGPEEARLVLVLNPPSAVSPPVYEPRVTHRRKAAA